MKIYHALLTACVCAFVLGGCAEESPKAEEPKEKPKKVEATKPEPKKEAKKEEEKQKTKPAPSAVKYAAIYEKRYEQLWSAYESLNDNPHKWGMWSAKFNREGRKLENEINQNFDPPNWALGLPGAEYNLWSTMNDLITGFTGISNQKILKDMDNIMKEQIQMVKDGK
jgi:hypothetical protein